MVPLQNTLTIRKIDTSDGSSELIVTETGTITKFYFDIADDKLYYYHNQSTFSYVDLTDDSITDLDDTLDACEDLFVYDGSLFAVDTSQDDLTYYKYTPGSPGTWGAVGTIAEGKTNEFNIGVLGGNREFYGICWDGTYFYVVDFIEPDAHIRKYNAALDTLEDSFDIGALGGNDAPKGICWDGTYFYVTDDDAYIYKYNAALDTLEDSFNIGALGGNDRPAGICWDGTYFYVVDYIDAYVYKYNSDLDTLEDSFNIGALGGNDVPKGICWDGTYFYVTDDDTYIYKYNSDLDTLINSFNIGALGGNDNSYGICWDNIYFYVIDYGDESVYKYHSDLITELGKVLYSTVISNDVYTIYQYITGDCKIYVKDLDTADNPVLLETLTSGYTIPYLEDQRGVSLSNDNNVLYFVLKKVSDELTYLCSYNISGDSFTIGSEFNVALMLNRNTDSTANPPFNLEKGFALSEDKIYQIPTTYTGRLNYISNYNFSDTIIAITDHYVIDASGNLYEMVDMIAEHAFLRAEMEHIRQDYSKMKLTYNSDLITIVPQLFVQIIGYYSADDQDRLFKGTYNFGDNDVDDDQDSIDFIDSYTLHDADCRIVESLDDHRNVLRLQDDATGGEDPEITHNETQATAGTREFWIATSDVTEDWQFGLVEDGVGYIVWLRITSSKFQYYDSLDAWQDCGQAAVNNTLYRIKIEWYADNTFDLYINGTLLQDGVACNNNQSSGVDEFKIECYGDSEDYIYLDAYGDPDNDSDYIEGDNQYIEEGGEDQVIFEGVTQKPTEGRIRHVIIVNQGSEIDEVKAQGSKSGRTDEIISDINDDGPPNGPSYIQDGILSAGTAMGNQDVDGKKLRTVYDDYSENDGFSWNLRPQGAFDYNGGDINSDVDFKFDGSTYTDTIRHLIAWKVAKNNQIIVNGAPNYTNDGKPYTGQWDDEEDQLINGINSITIEDASLNSDALCQSKADTLGALEADIIRAEFMFRKPLLGLIQVGQLITFYFNVSNYITISEATFVVDYIMINLISEVGHIAISSGV